MKLSRTKDPSTKIEGFPLMCFPGIIIDLEQKKSESTGLTKISLLILTPFLSAAPTMRTLVHPQEIIVEEIANPYNVKLAIPSPNVLTPTSGLEVRKQTRSYFFVAAIRPAVLDFKEGGRLYPYYEGFLHVIGDSLSDPAVASVLMPSQQGLVDGSPDLNELEVLLK